MAKKPFKSVVNTDARGSVPDGASHTPTQQSGRALAMAGVEERVGNR